MPWWQKVPTLRGISVSGYQCILIPITKPQDGQPIFVVVHGTWAREAQWSKSDTVLMSALGNTWADSGLLSFVWSGVNGVRHRIEAAKRLAESVDELHRAYPRSPLNIIAHSHGGNVVAWASTMTDCSMSAVVYLNTPFIQVMSVDDNSPPGVTLIICIIGFIGTYFALGKGLHAFPYFRNLHDVFWEKLIGSAAIVAFLLFGADQLNVTIMRTRQVMIELTKAPRNIARELCVIAIGDEAAITLGAVYFVRWIIGKLWWVPNVVVIVAICYGYFTSGITLQNAYIAAGVAFAQFAIGLLSFCAAMSGYGLWQGLISLDLGVTSAPTPEGEVDCMTVNWDDIGPQRHSRVLTSKPTITKIIGWLRATTPKES